MRENSIKKFLITIVAVLSFAGAAMAQFAVEIVDYDPVVWRGMPPTSVGMTGLTAKVTGPGAEEASVYWEAERGSSLTAEDESDPFNDDKHARTATWVVYEFDGPYGEMILPADEYDLVTAHAILDDTGKPFIGQDGTFQLAEGTNLGEFLTLREQLLDSVAEVDGPTYTGHLADVAQLLSDYDESLSGQSAEAYNVLYDAVEAALGEAANTQGSETRE